MLIEANKNIKKSKTRIWNGYKNFYSDLREIH